MSRVKRFCSALCWERHDRTAWRQACSLLQGAESNGRVSSAGYSMSWNSSKTAARFRGYVYNGCNQCSLVGCLQVLLQRQHLPAEESAQAQPRGGQSSVFRCHILIITRTGLLRQASVTFFFFASCAPLNFHNNFLSTELCVCCMNSKIKWCQKLKVVIMISVQKSNCLLYHCNMYTWHQQLDEMIFGPDSLKVV